MAFQFQERRSILKAIHPQLRLCLPLELPILLNWSFRVNFRQQLLIGVGLLVIGQQTKYWVSSSYRIPFWILYVWQQFNTLLAAISIYYIKLHFPTKKITSNNFKWYCLVFVICVYIRNLLIMQLLSSSEALLLCREWYDNPMILPFGYTVCLKIQSKVIGIFLLLLLLFGLTYKNYSINPKGIEHSGWVSPHEWSWNGDDVCMSIQMAALCKTIKTMDATVALITYPGLSSKTCQCSRGSLII